jgi:hypothetical protein
MLSNLLNFQETASHLTAAEDLDEDSDDGPEFVSIAYLIELLFTGKSR